MTLNEFREKTAHMPGSYELFQVSAKTEFKYGLINSVYVKEIPFTEDPNPDEDYDGPRTTETVLILDEE